MKRTLNFLLLLAIVVSVASCGSSSKGVTPPGGGGGTPPPPPPPPPSDTAYMKVVGATEYSIAVNIDTLIGVFEVNVLDQTPWASLDGVLQKYLAGTNEIYLTNEYYWLKKDGKTLKEGAFPIDSRHVSLDDWIPPSKGKYQILIGGKGTKPCSFDLSPAINFRIKGDIWQGPGCEGTKITFK
jgi:hypothetical protein